MNKKEFNQKLKDSGLSKKRFSELTNESYNTVLGWGRKREDKYIRIPNWIESWLKNYNEVNRLSGIKTFIDNCKKMAS